MPVVVTAAFKSWLKSNKNMKLSSDSAVKQLSCKGITTFTSLEYFDRKAIQSLSSICKEKIPAIAEDVAVGITAEQEVSGANISSISVQRLIVATDAAKYYSSIGRAMTPVNVHYANILSTFKIEWDAYISLKKEDAPKAPAIRDQDNNLKVIKWAPIFQDCLARTYGSRGPLIYVIRDDVAVPSETDDPLGVDETSGTVNSYFGSSGCLHNELVKRLSHTGPLFKHDNATVYMLLEKAARNTSVESMTKAFARKKDGRGVYLAVIANHAGDTSTGQYTRNVSIF